MRERSTTYGHDGKLLSKTKPAARRGERRSAWNRDPDGVDAPQPGFFLVRVVKGGPVVPARIYYGTGTDPDTGEALDRPLRLMAEVAGEPAKDIWEVWHSHRTLTSEADFRYRTDTIKWARQHRPGLPECHPRRKIVLSDIPPVTELTE